MKAEERRWIRWLHGELSQDEVRQLREDLRKDAASARRFEQFEALWQRLEGPLDEPLDPGFSVQVVAAARRLQTPLTWAQAPSWVRFGAAASLVLGLTLGSVASAREERVSDLESASMDELLFVTPGLADGYWLMLEDAEWLEEEGAEPSMGRPNTKGDTQ